MSIQPRSSLSSPSNLHAIIMMVASMGIFALSDTLIRLASVTGSGATSGQFIMLQSIIGSTMFLWLMRRQGESLSLDLLKNRNVQLRTLGDLVAASSIVTALTLLPVGTVSAILQIQPLLVTIAAVFILKEKVGINRWSAVVIGLIGGLIIMRPGVNGFQPATLLVLLSVFGMTMRDIYTRKLEDRFSSTAAVFIVSIALFPVGLALHWALSGQRPILEIEILPFTYIGVAAITAMAAYYVLVLAMRIGEISAIAPFRYSRLVAAFLVAWLILGEFPDGWTLFGSVIVVGAGIVVAIRERKVRQAETV